MPPTAKKDFTNLEREGMKLKKEVRRMRPKAEPLALPESEILVPPAPKASAPRGSLELTTPKVVFSPSKHAPAKVFRSRAPEKPAKQFPPSAKKLK
jgi:hypothetical protein